MISFYFGLPRCGKTTLLTRIALVESKKISLGKSRFKRVYTNVDLINIPFVYKIEFDYIGKYLIEDALVLIDEASVHCDNRDWKNFGRNKIAFMMLHGHYNTDFCFFSQSYNGYDSKLRSITENVYYVRKCLLPWFTRYVRIPYGIIIPDKKDNAGEKFGEIVEGYAKPSLIKRLLCPRIFRPLYYKYFDTHSRPLKLEPLPAERATKDDKQALLRACHL